ncbi:MAG TPA: beta-propeller fold lactonase family protein [Candidatus Limnocylindria bacterium]|nr:beta-propeller fold lactonase family protein [Candidatus Limnocylindria bacterium]
MIKNVSTYCSLIFLTMLPVFITAGNFGKVITNVMVGDTPAGSAVTPNGRYVYVANNNNDGIPNGDSVSVIEVATNTVITTIHDASFNEPYTITINAAGTKAYVTNSNSTTVTIIDIATNTVSGVITGFDGPSGFAITPDGNTAYVNNYGGPGGVGSGNGTTIRVVDLNTNTIVGPAITVDLAPASLAVTPNGEFVYVINYVDGNPGTGTANIIRTSDNTVVGRITGFSGPFKIAITPNGRYAYVTNFGSNNFSPVGTTVSVIDLNSNTIIATITLGTQPSGIAITPNGRFVYVSNYNTLYLGPNFTNLTPGQGTVNVIDVCTNKVLCPVIVVGASPADLTITPDGRRLYVSNYSANTVSVVDIVDRMWLNACN